MPVRALKSTPCSEMMSDELGCSPAMMKGVNAVTAIATESARFTIRRACDVPLGLQPFLEPRPEYLVDADGVRLLLWGLPPMLRMRIAHFARGALPGLLVPEDDPLLRLLL